MRSSRGSCWVELSGAASGFISQSYITNDKALRTIARFHRLKGGTSNESRVPCHNPSRFQNMRSSDGENETRNRLAGWVRVTTGGRTTVSRHGALSNAHDHALEIVRFRHRDQHRVISGLHASLNYLPAASRVSRCLREHVQKAFLSHVV